VVVHGGARGAVGAVRPGLTAHKTATGISMPNLEQVKDVTTMDLQLAEREMDVVVPRVDGDMPSGNEEVDGDRPNMGWDMPTSIQVETVRVEEATGVTTGEVAIPKICGILKCKHDIAKAVKDDDVGGPSGQWNCGMKPHVAACLASLRVFML
jgi:hypothetical protein